MTIDNRRHEFPREMVAGLMDRLTQAAVDRFGETARGLARDARPLAMPPDWHNHDFVDVLLTCAVPWTRTMMATFGREPVAELITESLRQPMREFGERAAAASDGTIAGRVERAFAPLSAGSLTTENRAASEDRVEFKVTKCRYAELLTQIGARDLGAVLVCQHDFAIADAMNLTLERPTTLMGGGPFCDFRYTPRHSLA